MTEAEAAGSKVRVQGPRCPFCRADVQPAEAKQACLQCMAWLHADCWREADGCPSCGARALPAPARQPAAGAPPETFQCLSCQRLMRAQAVGATPDLCRDCEARLPAGRFFCRTCRARCRLARRGAAAFTCLDCERQQEVRRNLRVFATGLALLTAASALYMLAR